MWQYVYGIPLLLFHSCETSSQQTLQAPSKEFFQENLRELQIPVSKTIKDVEITEVQGLHKKYKLSIQHFPEEQIVYISIFDYLSLKQSQSPASTTFLLTQIATLNYTIIGAKLQLNPQTGALVFGTEINVLDGLSKQTIQHAIKRLIRLADAHYEKLRKAMQGTYY